MPAPSMSDSLGEAAGLEVAQVREHLTDRGLPLERRRAETRAVTR